MGRVPPMGLWMSVEMIADNARRPDSQVLDKVEKSGQGAQGFVREAVKLTRMNSIVSGAGGGRKASGGASEHGT